MMCGFCSLNLSSRQYRTRYHGVYARLAMTQFSDALVLDRQLDVVHLVVEVADVAPVGHQRRVTELDVQIAVDDVVAAQHDLVAEPQRTLMRADGVLVPDVHPPADFQLRQFGCAVNLDTLTQKHHATRDDVRVTLLAEVAKTYVDIRQYQAQLTIANDTVISQQNTVAIA